MLCAVEVADCGDGVLCAVFGSVDGAVSELCKLSILLHWHYAYAGMFHPLTCTLHQTSMHVHTLHLPLPWNLFWHRHHKHVLLLTN